MQQLYLQDRDTEPRPHSAFDRFNAVFASLAPDAEAEIEADFVVPGVYDHERGPTLPLDRLLANRLDRDCAVSLARRCGLRLQSHEDRTAWAQAELDQRLARREATPTQRLRLEAYRRGLLCRQRLRLRRGPAPRYRLSLARHADMAAVRVLFREVFGHEMSEELWRWKYADAPWPAILVWHGEDLVGHYGMFPRGVLYRGVGWTGCQVGDVMVRQDHRTARGPLLHMGTACCELYEATDAGVTWGFPNARHYQVAELMGLYERVTTMHELRWPSLPALPGRLATQALEQLDRPGLRAGLDRLRSAFEYDLRHAVVCDRRHAYLQRRYWDRPDAVYHRHLVLRDGQLIGFIVIGRGTTALELLDVIAPFADLPDCLAAARALAASLGSAWLHVSITEPFDTLMRLPGTEVGGEGCVIPTTIWTSKRWPAALRGGWWLMGGDTDYL